MSLLRSSLCIAITLAIAPFSTSAAPPTLDAIFPAGGKAGSEVEVTFVGKIEPWPGKLWFSEKGFQFTPDPDEKKKGKGKLKIPAGLKTNAVLIRAYNEEGASEPAIFAIGDKTEILEEEKDGSSVGKATALDPAKFPLVVNGRLEKSHELDSWKIPLNKGQKIYAFLDGYALRSPVDPSLHIYDSVGNRLDLIHDGSVNLDPRMQFEAPAKGDYILSIAGFAHPPAATIYYTGSSKSTYRLHLATDLKQLPAHFSADDIGKDGEKEKATAPLSISGTLAKESEKDTVILSAKKGDSWLIKAEAFVLGFPTDPVLTIFKPDGASLKEIDDVKPNRDSEYLWKVAADGEYKIQVRDRLGRGGPDFRYRLKINKPVPDFKSIVEKSNYVVKQGEEISIKVTLTREYSHKTPLTLRIDPLPKGLKLTPPEKIPEKSGDITLKLKADDKAPAFSGPVKFLLKEQAEDKSKGNERITEFSFQDDKARGPYLINETETIWLTIPPKKKEEKKKDGAKDEKKK